MFLKRDRIVAPIDGSRAAAELFAPYLLGLANERLCVAHLDRELRLLHVGVCPGEDRHVHVPLRLIVSEALLLGTRGLILAHNHPSGDPRPSEADRRATREVAEAAGPLDIRLLDHLVFAEAQVASFRDLGLL